MSVPVKTLSTLSVRGKPPVLWIRALYGACEAAVADVSNVRHQPRKLCKPPCIMR